MDEKIPNLILITGDEAYLKEQKRDELLRSLGAYGSPNFNTFTDESIDLEEIRRLAETMPFFEETRKILIVNSGLFKKASSGEGDKGPAVDAAVQIFSGIPASTAVIFMENDAAAQNSLYKLVKKCGAIYRFDSVESMKGRGKSQGKNEVRNWARGQLEASGRRIDESALSGLLELSGYEMMNLSTELEKLLSYTLDRPSGYRITREDVDAICSVTLTDRVFSMAEMKLKGNVPGALAILEELFALRVPPMKILSILEKQYERCFLVKESMASGMGDAEIMAGLELKDWQLRQVKGQVRSVSADELRDRLEACVDMDYKVKTGDITDRLALEVLVIG